MAGQPAADVAPGGFWKPGTRVTLSTLLTGVQTGVGKYVGNDASTSFTIGSAMVSTVNMRTHPDDGDPGRPDDPDVQGQHRQAGAENQTRYGTKVIIERESALTMDSATVGIPKETRTTTRSRRSGASATWTGEFIHSAPWSTSAQGSANVLHGCTNMAPDDAEWMFTHSKMGDVVNFTGSPSPSRPPRASGSGSTSYAGWKAQSALVDGRGDDLCGQRVRRAWVRRLPRGIWLGVRRSAPVRALPGFQPDGARGRRRARLRAAAAAAGGRGRRGPS